MNRGSDGPHGRARACGRASMRPRFMNRGSPADPDRCRVRMLGFNEAPIHESGKCESLAAAAQAKLLLQ